MFQEQGAGFIVLDLGLPDMDGLEVCRQLRAESEGAIVMFTVRDGGADLICGLECGADDYITNPFDQMELLARARSALRRGPRPVATEATFANGRLRIGFDGRDVRIDGDLFRLMLTEYHLLLQLSQSAGKLVTHEELLTRLWGAEGFGVPNTWTQPTTSGCNHAPAPQARR